MHAFPDTFGSTLPGCSRPLKQHAAQLHTKPGGQHSGQQSLISLLVFSIQIQLQQSLAYTDAHTRAYRVPAHRLQCSDMRHQLLRMCVTIGVNGMDQNNLWSSVIFTIIYGQNYKLTRMVKHSEIKTNLFKSSNHTYLQYVCTDFLLERGQVPTCYYKFPEGGHFQSLLLIKQIC